MNFKNMLFVTALFFSAASVNSAPEVVVKAVEVATETVPAICDSCLFSSVTGAISGTVISAKDLVLEHPTKTVLAAVVLGAIVYFVATAEDADTDAI